MADPPSLLVVSAEKWSKGKFSDVGMDNDEYTHIYIYIYYITLYYIILYCIIHIIQVSNVRVYKSYPSDPSIGLNSESFSGLIGHQRRLAKKEEEESMQPLGRPRMHGTTQVTR